MSKQTIRAILLPILVLATLGLACAVSNPLDTKGVATTAAAVGETIEAGVTSLAPTLEAIMTDAPDLLNTVEAGVTDIAPTVKAIGTLIPVEIGGVEEIEELIQGDEGLSGLASFRQSADVTLESEGKKGEIEYWAEFTTDPLATHGKVTLSGEAAEGRLAPEFEYKIIDNKAWVKLFGGFWVQTPGSVGTVTGRQPYSAGDFLIALPDTDTLQRVEPDKTVNGILCQHYVYNVTNLEFEHGQLDSASGEIYTAVDGGYVVQYTLHGQGYHDEYFDGELSTLDIVYNVFDVNDPSIDITPP